MAASRSITPTFRAPNARRYLLWRECGARVTGYYFDVSRDDCRARNATRIGKARVPEFVVGMLGNQLELPTYAEGFDALLRVVLAPDGAPIVTV